MIFALADDLTGALEIGAKFAEYDLASLVVTDVGSLANREYPVLVIDTETRHLTAEEAATRTGEMASVALGHSPLVVYQKTDSTLRGNIAAELRAIQALFSTRRLVYAPAYPDLGRTVKGGELFIWGTRVHETEFANDPWNPVNDCRIASVLGDVPALILDGESNADVEAAVRTIMAGPPPRLCAGPAALAGALARHLQPGVQPRFHLPKVSRCLVVNGSVHAVSVQQMKLATEQGLFDDNWIPFNQSIPGCGMERAIETGNCARRMLNSSHFDALLVFGGDTAFGIHRSLGSVPFEPKGEIAPGVPVSESGGLLWITKAGGFGPPGIIASIRDRLS